MGARDLRLGPSLWSGAGRADDRYQTSLDRARSGTGGPRHGDKAKDEGCYLELRFVFLQQSVLDEMYFYGGPGSVTVCSSSLLVVVERSPWKFWGATNLVLKAKRALREMDPS